MSSLTLSAPEIRRAALCGHPIDEPFDGQTLLTAEVIAVRQAPDYCTTLRAIAVCAIGFPLSALLLTLALLFTGPWPF